MRTGFNSKLRQKRNKNKVRLWDFPLEVRIKPTAHKQHCFLCRELINKDDKQVCIISGFWRRMYNKGLQSVRPDRTVSGQQILFNRHIYFHTNCFSCLLKKMFQRVNAKLEPNCESCSLRFNCFTNNIDMLDPSPYKAYTSSHPCGGSDDDDK